MKSTVIKYLVAIIVCEVVLFLNWIHLAADADISKYDSIKKLLDSNAASQNFNVSLAASAIHTSSLNLHIMSVLVCATTFAVTLMSGLVMVKLLKSEDDHRLSD